MVNCSVKWCGKTSRTSSYEKDGITFHRFPKSPEIKQKWIDAANRGDLWFPSNCSVICSRHFTVDCFNTTHNRRRKHLIDSAVPTIFLPMLSHDSGAPIPGPSAGTSSETSCRNNQDSSDSNLSTPDLAQDPLKKGTLEQCRFCGEFGKDCIDLTTDHKPYLEKHKTSLTVNGLTIELDFNDDTLPKTVCANCDMKLEEMTDFVKKVIAAQSSLIDVADDMETLAVKVEDAETEDVQTEEDEGLNDALEVSQVFTHKRKSDKPGPKQKKRKTKNRSDNSESMEQVNTTQEKHSVSNLDSENSTYTHKKKSDGTSNSVPAQKSRIFRIEIPLQRQYNRHDQGENSEFSRQNIETDNTTIQEKHDSNVSCEDTELIMDIKKETTETEESHKERLEFGGADFKPDEAELASNALVYEMSKSCD